MASSVSQIICLSARGLHLGSRVCNQPVITGVLLKHLPSPHWSAAACLAAPSRLHHSSGWGSISSRALSGSGSDKQKSRAFVDYSEPSPQPDSPQNAGIGTASPTKPSAVDMESLTQFHKEQHMTGTNIKTPKSVEENIEDIRKGDFTSVTNPTKAKHFKKTSADDTASSSHLESEKEPIMGSVAMPHPIWSQDEVYNVQITHQKPVGFIDKFALLGVQTTRKFFDQVSGFNSKVRDERIWLNRLCFLETIAAVPGMVAAMVRHLHSLRRMSRDHGWIHTLLEEAENERMHLMTFLLMKKPSWAFRMSVVATQGIFVSGFSVAYLLSPKLCHRFVGYLEEEAVITYSKLLKDIDRGTMQHWQTTPASKVAINYWNLAPTATMKDVILAIRADEAHHRIVNHTLGSLKATDFNPYRPGE